MLLYNRQLVVLLISKLMIAFSYLPESLVALFYLDHFFILITVVVVVLHMPGLVRWLTPGRSSCGSTLFIIIFYYLFILFFCFFFLLLSLLLPLLRLHASFLSSFSCSSWGRLPFLAGEVSGSFFGRRGKQSFFWQEVGCLFGRIFPRGGDIACMCEGCSGGVFVVCQWPKQGWESTHRLHLYPLSGVFYSP